MADGLTFTVDQTDLEQLRRRVSDKRTKVGRVMAVAADPAEHYTQYLGVRVASAAARKAPRDTGRLSRSLSFTFTDGGGQVSAETPYARWVHEGTRAHWPPPAATAGWARRHGIPNFLVGRAIARRGTRARPFLREAFDQVMSTDLAPGLQGFAQDVAVNWGTE